MGNSMPNEQVGDPVEVAAHDVRPRAERRLGPVDASWNERSARGPVEILGIPFVPETLREAVDRVADRIAAKAPCHIGVVDAAKVVNVRRDPALREAVLASDVIYADGMSIVLASRLLGTPLPARVAGIDLMLGILERGNEAGYRVYCLGATEEISRRAATAIAHRFPNVRIVGRRNGYFDDADEQTIVDDVVRSRAQEIGRAH